MPALIAKAPVGVVLHDEEIVLVRQLDQALAALGRHGDATGFWKFGMV